MYSYDHYTMLRLGLDRWSGHEQNQHRPSPAPRIAPPILLRKLMLWRRRKLQVPRRAPS
ncbi:hypothetical protein KX928_22150 [Roseobacter sp. YSTF-M11]|uniref:Uncharacterized protein n=1 Tax=Roseobacter insulae TaxID=2859783 RepID=A0A9X1FZB8_9RHOB|nr:hypothetical protein [Roseobacter insulae]MBW4710499.1 hypothetical protein [Roseobacter insulae]